MHIHPPGALPIPLVHPTERSLAAKRAAETRKKLTFEAASILGEQDAAVWTVEPNSESSSQPGFGSGTEDDRNLTQGLSITV